MNRAAVAPKRTEHRPNVSDQGDDEDVTTKKNRNRSELMYEDEDDKPNERLDKIIVKERERLEREKNERKNSDDKKRNSKATKAGVATDDRSGASSSQVTAKTASKNDTPNRPSSSRESDRPTAKRQSSPVAAVTPPPVKKVKSTRERTYRPFRKLLDGVVLVISGIQVSVDSMWTVQPTLSLTLFPLSDFRIPLGPIFDNRRWRWEQSTNQTGKRRARI